MPASPVENFQYDLYAIALPCLISCIPCLWLQQDATELATHTRPVYGAANSTDLQRPLQLLPYIPEVCRNCSLPREAKALERAPGFEIPLLAMAEAPNDRVLTETVRAPHNAVKAEKLSVYLGSRCLLTSLS